jgi:murein L,D-transpeptidase YafK
MKSIPATLALVLLTISVDAASVKPVNYEKPLTLILDSMELSSDSLSLLIDKSDYKLSLLYDSCIIKEYPVVFGGNPKDDKLMKGDLCTPEGTFYMISKYPHQKWSKFIWINYPNENSWQKHAAARNKGIIPPEAGIGGQIGIHGVPEGNDKLIDLRKNWTLGCISLKNNDIDEIYSFINGNTKIIIRK